MANTPVQLWDMPLSTRLWCHSQLSPGKEMLLVDVLSQCASLTGTKIALDVSIHHTQLSNLHNAAVQGVAMMTCSYLLYFR